MYILNMKNQMTVCSEAYLETFFFCCQDLQIVNIALNLGFSFI